MPFLAPVATFVGGIVSGVSSFLASGTILAGLAKAAIGIGLNYAINALFGGGQQPAGGADLEVQYGVQSRIVRCGRFGVAGHYTFANTSGGENRYLQQVFTISDYYTTSLDKVWIDGEVVTLGATDPQKGRVVTSGDYAGLIWLKYYDGRQTAADAYLVAQANPSSRWTSAYKGEGVSYIIATLKYDREKLGQTVSFLFEGKGAPLYDWRKDSTVGGSGSHRFSDVKTHEFSENPILMEYHYRRGFSVNGDLFCGMGWAPTQLPLDRYSLAANLCDEISQGGPRFRCAVGLDCNIQHGDNIDALMRSCGGLSVRTIDGAFPIVGHDQTVVATLTDDDLLTDAPVYYQAKRAGRELINSISGTFPNPDAQWAATDYKTATSSALVTADRSSKDVAINFETVPYPQQAAQLAATYLSENRFEATASIVVRPRWQVLEPGDWIIWNSARYGQKTYVVTDMQIGSLTSEMPDAVALTLQERSGNIYTTIGVVAPPVIQLPPGEPVQMTELDTFTVIASNATGDGAQIVPAIRTSWSAITDPTISGIVLEYRLKSGPGPILERTVSSDKQVALLLEGVVSNSEYEVRHRLVADPPRSFSPSAWVSVVTPDTPANDVSVGLGQVREDVSAILAQVMAQYDLLIDRTEASAGDAAIDAATEYLARKVIEKRVGDALARIIREEQVRADADGALAQSIQAVEASIGQGLAGGLIAIRAAATPSGGAAAQIDFIVRAGENGVETVTAMSLRAYSNGDSDILMSAGRLVVTDDNSNEVSPLVFENGQLVADIARFKAAVAEKFTTPNGKVTFGTLAVGVEGLEIKT